MTKVRISLQTGGPAAHGICARIIRLADANGRPAGYEAQDVAISSNAVLPDEVDLDRGFYAIEVNLPNGEVLCKQIATSDHDDAVVNFTTKELRAATQPHNQQLGTIAARDFEYPSARGMFRTDFSGDALTTNSNLAGNVWISATIDTLSGGQAWDSIWHLPIQRTEYPQDAYSHTHVIERSYGSYRLAIGAFPEAQRRRFWAIAKQGENLILASLPLPWNLARAKLPRSPSSIELLSQQAEDGFGLKVSAMDPHFTSLLAYLGGGRGGLALSALRKIRQMDARIYRNSPFAVCAAGYLAAAHLQGEELAFWDGEVSKAYEAYDWLPDLAIIKGWLLLRQNRSVSDIADACELFKLGFRLGLPFFSMGIQYLLDGLSVCRADDEADASRAKTLAAAAHVQLSEAFTVLKLPNSQGWHRGI